MPCSIRLPALLAWLALAVPEMRGEPPRTDFHGDPLPPGAVARLGSARFRHDHLPGPAAFSPDGKTMAVLVDRLETATLWIWDVQTGKNLRRFTLNVRTSGSLMFTPDGRLLVIGLEEVYLLDSTTAKTVRKFALAEKDFREQQLS